MLFSNGPINSRERFIRLNGSKYSDCSVRFKSNGKRSDYSKQYAHIYSRRLDEIRPLLLEKVKKKWGTKYPTKRMSDLREDNPEKCIIIGTTFVHQRLKPSILKEISEEMELAPQPIRQKFVDESDILILEDEVQRIQLLNMEAHNIVTGVVCAVLGYENDEGKFHVDECLFHESSSEPEKLLREITTDPLIIFISGIDQSSTHDFSVSLELFQQWLYGNIPNTFGGDDDLDWEASNVIRVIVAGNSVRTCSEIRPKSILMRQPESVSTLQAVKSVDALISSWCDTTNVDLMPGEYDPANCMLPQQPMHNCMFPECTNYAATSFKCVTNPYEFEIEDRLILGTSGQNVSNVQKFSNIDHPLDVLKSIIRWGVLAPTAPDTLPCYPYTENDPFIIRQCPHILFAGNTSEYSTCLYEVSEGKTVRLICVPSFSKVESIVVVNLRNLECKQLCFKLKEFEDLEL